MTTNDEMTTDEIYKYLRKIQPLCAKTDRKQKRQYLDEMESVTG
jgi:hypothetical protein